MPSHLPHSKLKFIKALQHCRRGPSDLTTDAAIDNQGPPLDVQIIGLSATLPNLEEVADWMDAALFHTSFRPVELQEMYKWGDALFAADGVCLRRLQSRRPPAEDPDHITTLVEETTRRGHQVLVFCHYRKHCENCATLLAEQLGVLPGAIMANAMTRQKKEDKESDDTVKMRKALLDDLREHSMSVHPCLLLAIPKGIAFHHAGLTDHEKNALEEAFRRGVLSVIVATSTLGTGINLPAARVIFRTLRPGGNRVFDISSYRQMAGRAGRAGQQKYGESILLARSPQDVKEATRLMTEPLHDLHSCLDPEQDGGRALVRAILEAIASGSLQKNDDLDIFLHCTLALRQRIRHSPRLNSFLYYARDALRYLVEHRIVKQLPGPSVNAEVSTSQRAEHTPEQKEQTVMSTAAPPVPDIGSTVSTLLSPSKLGHALFKSSFAPDEGLLVFQDLKHAQQRLVLDGNLHLIYLVTPVFHPLLPDYNQLWKIYDRARRTDPVKALIFELIGFSEALLDRWSHQQPASGVLIGPLLHLGSSEAGNHTARGLAQPIGRSIRMATGVVEGEQLMIMRARRLWGALALHDLAVAERPLDATAATYGVDRGSLQALQQSAASYVGMIQSFLTQLGWTLLSRALEEAGTAVGGEQVKELMPLMQIPRLELSLARALYDTDVRTVAAVCSEPVEHLADIIRKIRPFSAEKRGDGVAVPGLESDEMACYDEAARRLREAAHFVLKKGNKIRRSKMEESISQGADPGSTSSLHGIHGDSTSSSDSDVDAYDGAHGVSAAFASCLGANEPIPSASTCSQSGRIQPDSCPGHTEIATLTRSLRCLADVPSKKFFETPVAMRHPKLRPEDYPMTQRVSTPTRSPTSSHHYLYIPDIPSVPLQHSPGSPNTKKLESSMTLGGWRGKQLHDTHRTDFIPENLAFPCTFVTAATVNNFTNFVNRWNESLCYSVVLHYRPVPLVSDWRGDVHAPSSSFSESHAYHRYATRLTPCPLVSGKLRHAFYTPRMENFIICGLAVSFDGQHSNYCWLPPPFSRRPFEGLPCLGDDMACATSMSAGKKRKIRVVAVSDRSVCMVNGEDKSSKSCSDETPTRSILQVSIMQGLPERPTMVVFAFVGYQPRHLSTIPKATSSVNEPAGGDGPNLHHVYQEPFGRQNIASYQYSNPAMLLCRRWNRLGCAWFNEYASLQGWQAIKSLLAKKGTLKVVWDAVTVLATLRERNVSMAGPFEDPKVGLALLGRDGPRRGASGVSNNGPLHFEKLDQACDTGRVDLLGAQAAGLLQLRGAVGKMLANHQLLDPFRLIEMPLLPVLADMQFYGMRVDRSWFPGTVLAIQTRLLLLQDLADAMGGCHLNLNCQDAVHHLLYVVLRLPVPPKWSRKTKVWGEKCHSEKTVLGPVETEWLEGMVNLSPAVKLILEWRQLSAALRNLQSIRNCIRPQALLGSHRVRCRVHPSGSATGRITLSEPALQQVAHEVLVRETVRASIQDEIEGRRPLAHKQDSKQDGSSLPSYLFTDDISASLDQTYPVNTYGYIASSQVSLERPKIAVAAVRVDSYLWANVSEKSNFQEGYQAMTSQFGTLRCILNARISQPFPSHKVSHALAPNQVQQQSSFILNPNSSAARLDSSLADYWRSRGFNYSFEDAMRIRQCVIEFPPGVVLTYPADKVYRRPDPIHDPLRACHSAFDDMINPATVLKPRMAFLAARGCVLISADYSQIELRMLAHFSADPLLCDALKRDEDVFQTLAATWRRVAIENVTRAMRDEAKQLAYAVLYGQSIAATAQQFAISTAEADKLHVSFLNTYPGIRKFLQESKDFCKTHGYIETLLRRRRHLPGIHSRNIYERLQAERQSVNSICQGSAAEIIKLAMINIHSKLEGLHCRIKKDSLGDVRDCRLVLQIHDELIFEVKEQMVTEVVQIMKDCMEGALQLNVPLKVHVKVGASWGALA